MADPCSAVHQEPVQGARTIEADEMTGNEINEANRRRIGKRIAFANDENETILPKRKRLQSSGLDRTGDDADLGHALGYEPYDLVAEPLPKLDGNPGMDSQEASERFRQKLGQRVGVRQ